MTHLSVFDFREILIEDFKLEDKYVHTSVLKLPAEQSSIRKFGKGLKKLIVVIDDKGDERPYLENTTLTILTDKDRKLKFTALASKTLTKLISEAKEKGAIIFINPCKICEGNGWYSKGSRYIYNNFYTEI